MQRVSSGYVSQGGERAAHPGRGDGAPCRRQLAEARSLVNGKRANVGVVNGPNGKYVRTYADGVWNDNLLALYECV